MKIVTKNHKGKLYNPNPLPKGARMIGEVVRDDTDQSRGALVLLASGQYVQVNAGIVRGLSQWHVKEALSHAEDLGGVSWVG